MKAVQLVKYGNPLEGFQVAEIPEPGQPAPDQILVKVDYAPVLVIDRLQAEQMHGAELELPVVAGHEGAGKVLAVGSEISGIYIGDHVALSRGVSTWAEKVFATSTQVAVIPKDLDPQQASMLSINPPTALLLLEEVLNLQRGDWVVQNSANSGVARAVIAFAKSKGVRTVNLVRRTELVSELKALGADVVLVVGPDTPGEVARATAGASIRLGLDSVGGESTGLLAQLVGWDSRIVCYAAPEGDIKVSSLTTIGKHASIVPFYMYYPEYLAKLDGHIQKGARLVAEGKLHAPVAATYKPDDIKQALKHAIAGGKILLDFTGK